MIKKIMALALITIMVIAFAGCGESRQESVSVKDADLYSEYKIEEAAVSQKPEFSQDGISVTVGDLIYEDVTTKLSMNIKNETDKSVTVTTAEFSVNGLMCSDVLMETVEPKEKSEAFVEISNQWFGEMNISTITDMEFVIKVFDEKNEEIMKSQVLLVKTDAPWTYRQKYEMEGIRLYSEDGITLAVKEMKKSALSNDYELVFYIENKTNKTLSVMSDDVEVNGTPIEPLFVLSVGPKKKAVESMLFYEKDLEEREIEKIKTVNASFKAFDENLETVFETKVIKVPVK